MVGKVTTTKLAGWPIPSRNNSLHGTDMRFLKDPEIQLDLALRKQELAIHGRQLTDEEREELREKQHDRDQEAAKRTRNAICRQINEEEEARNRREQRIEERRQSNTVRPKDFLPITRLDDLSEAAKNEKPYCRGTNLCGGKSRHIEIKGKRPARPALTRFCTTGFSSHLLALDESV